MKSAKKRLDIFIVEKGLAPTRSKAQAFIMSGAVLINGEIVYKASVLVGNGDEVKLKDINPYVSRGGLKLQSALERLNIDVKGLVCLDIGASTGGFTDCLLQSGALKVYAIDVGYGQLHYKLRSDERVINIEKVNFRYFDASLIKDNVDFACIDVSFISLDKILPTVKKVVAAGGKVLAMIKPQFELSPQEVKKGVVRDEVLRMKAIEKIRSFAIDLGFVVIGSADSAIKGPKGNLEHFLYLSVG